MIVKYRGVNSLVTGLSESIAFCLYEALDARQLNAGRSLFLKERMEIAGYYTTMTLKQDFTIYNLHFTLTEVTGGLIARYVRVEVVARPQSPPIIRVMYYRYF